jgi:phosphoribosylanthranilate isomerase
VDALHAVKEGATALGFVFWANSPRAISPADAKGIIAALPPKVTPVGVFVNESPETLRDILKQTGIRAVQLHGDETLAEYEFIECPLLKSAALDHLSETARAWPAETTLLLDAADRVKRGGTGVAVDWNKAAAAARTHKVVLAGGLTPLNVEEAIRTVRPIGVDVASGVEASPGIKDFAKVSAFLTNARQAFAAL